MAQKPNRLHRRPSRHILVTAEEKKNKEEEEEEEEEKYGKKERMNINRNDHLRVVESFNVLCIPGPK